MNTMKKFACLMALVALSVVSSFAAQSYAVISGRSFATTGYPGCTVSGATNATPIVVTCSAAHRLVDGDPIQITGVGGNTNANTVGFAKITTYSATTFGLFSDAALTTGVAGNASYTSGGAVSFAYDISGITGDWTIRLRVESLTSAKKAFIEVQESADGFVSDIRTIMTHSFTGTISSAAMIDKTLRSYNAPSARFGVTSARIRVNVIAIDGSAAVVPDLFIEY